MGDGEPSWKFCLIPAIPQLTNSPNQFLEITNSPKAPNGPNSLKFCQFSEILPILRTNSFKLLFLNSPKAFYAANSISKIWAQPNPKKPEIPRYGLNPTRPEFPKYGLNPTRKNPNFPAMGSTRPDLTRISKIWAQPDPKKPEIRVKMAGLTRFSGQNCPP